MQDRVDMYRAYRINFNAVRRKEAPAGAIGTGAGVVAGATVVRAGLAKDW